MNSYPTYAAAEAAAEAAAGAVLMMIPMILLVLLLPAIINGIFCKKLAAKKGYTGYFWTGFFFSIIGLLYVIGLPDLNIRKDMRAVMKRMVAVSDRVDGLEQGMRQNY